MVGFKTGISKIYAHARDRAYTYTLTKQGRTDLGLRSSRKLRALESGNKSLRWKRNGHYLSLKLSSLSSCLHDKLLEKLRERGVRFLNLKIPKQDYLLRFPGFPHQILRNHPLAQGAGADRVSKGMSKAFGKGFSLASKLKKGQSIIETYLKNPTKELTEMVKKFYKSLNPCIPGKTYTQVNRVS